MENNEDNILNIIKNNMINIIEIETTFGRPESDYCLVAYTIDEVNEFIQNNDELINKIVEQMYQDYNNDDDLDLLLNNPLRDWFTEYMDDIFDLIYEIN